MRALWFVILGVLSFAFFTIFLIELRTWQQVLMWSASYVTFSLPMMAVLVLWKRVEGCLVSNCAGALDLVTLSTVGFGLSFMRLFIDGFLSMENHGLWLRPAVF